jgi:hypothetical protein
VSAEQAARRTSASGSPLHSRRARTLVLRRMGGLGKMVREDPES